MHELSVAHSLLELIEEHSKANDASSVLSVKIQVGRLSGIEPELLESAFDVVKRDSVAHDAKLIMDVVDVRIRCNHCQKESVLEDFVFFCPECGATDVRVLEGEGMFLQSLEMEK